MKVWQAGAAAVFMMVLVVAANLALLGGAVWFVVWLLRQLKVLP